MIASLRGIVVTLSLGGVILDVHGVGYLVRCTPRTLATLRLGAEVTLATAMVVREDSLTVYGFGDSDEREMFELLQTASGVGPKVAQAMLAVHDPDALRTAIAGSDVKALTAVPGIGQKGAERVVLELRDRVGPALRPISGGEPTWRSQVHEALLGLGWSPRDADRAVDSVAGGLAADVEPDTSALLRDALRSLAGRR